MTENTINFGAGIDKLESMERRAGFRKGANAVNLANIFASRGINVHGGDEYEM